MNTDSSEVVAARAAVRVLFVCTANISRSPYAERRAAQLLAGAPGVSLGSAGIPGYPGRDMDPEMAAMLVERGTTGEGHVSQQLTVDLMAESDLVLTMAFSHHMQVLDSWPDFSQKVFGLGQFAAGAERLRGSVAAEPEASAGTVAERVRAAGSLAGRNSMTLDVADPYRRGTAAARACARQIDELLGQIVPLFQS